MGNIISFSRVVAFDNTKYRKLFTIIGYNISYKIRVSFNSNNTRNKLYDEYHIKSLDDFYSTYDAPLISQFYFRRYSNTFSTKLLYVQEPDGIAVYASVNSSFDIQIQQIGTYANTIHYNSIDVETLPSSTTMNEFDNRFDVIDYNTSDSNISPWVFNNTFKNLLVKDAYYKITTLTQNLTRNIKFFAKTNFYTGNLEFDVLLSSGTITNSNQIALVNSHIENIGNYFSLHVYRDTTSNRLVLYFRPLVDFLDLSVLPISGNNTTIEQEVPAGTLTTVDIITKYGATQTLPASIRGYEKFEVTGRKPIFWDGGSTKWRNADGQTHGLKRGTTAQRPVGLDNGLDIGYEYFDTTIIKPIWWTGSIWIDSTGATV